MALVVFVHHYPNQYPIGKDDMIALFPDQVALCQIGGDVVDEDDAGGFPACESVEGAYGPFLCFLQGRCVSFFQRSDL